MTFFKGHYFLGTKIMKYETDSNYASLLDAPSSVKTFKIWSPIIKRFSTSKIYEHQFFIIITSIYSFDSPDNAKAFNSVKII